jgi:hypothetical protein
VSNSRNEQKVGRPTLLDQVLLVIDDANVLLRQIPDRLVLHLPQLLRDLRNETCTNGNEIQNTRARGIYIYMHPKKKALRKS